MEKSGEVGAFQKPPPERDEVHDMMRRAIPQLWMAAVIGVPYLILGWWGGFGTSFQSGAASAFMCGAIVAAIAENVIEQAKSGFSRLRESLKKREINDEGYQKLSSVSFRGSPSNC